MRAGQQALRWSRSLVTEPGTEPGTRMVLNMVLWLVLPPGRRLWRTRTPPSCTSCSWPWPLPRSALTTPRRECPDGSLDSSWGSIHAAGGRRGGKGGGARAAAALPRRRLEMRPRVPRGSRAAQARRDIALAHSHSMAHCGSCMRCDNIDAPRRWPRSWPVCALCALRPPPSPRSLRDVIDKTLASDRALSLVVAIETALEDGRYEVGGLGEGVEGGRRGGVAV